MKANKYDLLIFLLIATTAFGNWGGYLQVTRIIGICSIPLLMVRMPKCQFAKPYGITILLFLFYCILSLLWTPDKTEGIKQLVYYIVHLLIFLEILVFSRFAKKPLQCIMTGWLMAVSLTLVVAMWELITDQHLSLSALDSESYMNTGRQIVFRRFASVTFYNYNTYVTFLCFAFPFLFCGLMCTNSWKYQHLLTNIAIVLAIICIIFNSSRGGLISIIVMGSFFLWIYMKKRQSLFMLLFLLTLLGGIVYRFSDELFLAIKLRLDMSDNNLIESDESRFTIWANALVAFKPTIGLGTGIGGVQASMKEITDGVTIPHNLLLEILVEFGGLWFLTFLRYLWSLLSVAKQLSFTYFRYTVYIALSAFPFYTIIDSSVLLKTFFYAAMASLTVFANYERIRFIHKTVRFSA